MLPSMTERDTLVWSRGTQTIPPFQKWRVREREGGGYITQKKQKNGVITYEFGTREDLDQR